MRKYPGFFIKVDDDDTPKFLAAVGKALSNGWSHGPDSPGVDIGWPFYTFFREPRPDYPAIALTMVRFDSETIRIVNLIPKEDHLSIDRYKAVLDDFRTSILEKVLDSGFQITLFQGSDEEHIEELMPPNAFRLLDRFVTLANKRTGSLHPYDCSRWQQFLICLHFNAHNLTDTHLKYWAMEQGFESQASDNLAHELNFGLQLLKLYDQVLARRAKTSGASL
jgi:hypothetical protein